MKEMAGVQLQMKELKAENQYSQDCITKKITEVIKLELGYLTNIENSNTAFKDDFSMRLMKLEQKLLAIN